MHRIIQIVLIGIISFGLAASAAAEDSSSQALQVAEKFINLVDSGNYKEAYQSAATQLQKLDSLPDWIEQQQRSRSLLGAPLERKLKSINARTEYPSLPDGEYLLIYYELRTEHKANAAEIILVDLQENGWFVCSYSIR